MKKNYLLTFFFVFVVMTINAQEDMPIVWETKLDHKIDYNGTGTEARGHSYAASEKELSVFNNDDGSILWTKSFSDLAPKLRKINDLIPFWESNTIFLFDRKAGKDQIACVDIESGKLLWNSQKYQNVTEEVVVYVPEEDGFLISLKESLVFLKAHTGEEVWSTSKFKGAVGKYVLLPGTSEMVMVNFVPGGLAAFFTGFKNQIARINLKNGDIKWEATYIGRAEKKVITKEFVYTLDVIDDKVYLKMNGMQTYDLNTGATLWSAAFDFTAAVAPAPSGKILKFGVYGAVADPVIVGDDIFVLDMSGKKSQYIKKFDKHTGKLLWTSGEIKGAKAIPNMYIVGDKVLLQIGGKVERQYKRRYKSGDSWVTEWAVDYPDVKPYGVQAYNTSDGSLAWESEKFKKGITNMLDYDGDIIVSSGKALYSIDYMTGTDKYEVDVKNGGVGNASLIVPYGDDVIVVVGDKGISKFKVDNGDLICSSKYKASMPEDRINDIIIMKTDKADIACFDLDSNCEFKEFKAKKGATTTLSLEAEYVYVYENKVVTKVRTK